MLSPTSDYYTLITREEPMEWVSIENNCAVKHLKKGKHRYWRVSQGAWNGCGKTPFISLVSGSIRAILGLADVIIGVVKAIFLNCNDAGKIAYVGIQNFFRGSIEAAPGLYLVATYHFLLVPVMSNVLTFALFFGGSAVLLELYDKAVKDPSKNVIREA